MSGHHGPPRGAGARAISLGSPTRSRSPPGERPQLETMESSRNGAVGAGPSGPQPAVSGLGAGGELKTGPGPPFRAEGQRASPTGCWGPGGCGLGPCSLEHRGARARAAAGPGLSRVATLRRRARDKPQGPQGPTSRLHIGRPGLHPVLPVTSGNTPHVSESLEEAMVAGKVRSCPTQAGLASPLSCQPCRAWAQRAGVKPPPP